MKFDRQLYDRQVYAIGADAMTKMSNTAVLIVGCDGLGVETGIIILITFKLMRSLQQRT